MATTNNHPTIQPHLHTVQQARWPLAHRLNERPVALIADGEGEGVELLEMYAGDVANKGTGLANVRRRAHRPGQKRERGRQTRGK